MTGWDEVTKTAEGRHGVVTLGDLLGTGLSRRDVERRVARGHLTPLGPTVWRIAGAPESFEAGLLGVLLGIEGEAWASHCTAARLWGIRVHGPVGVIEITRPYGASANRGAVQIHRSTRVPAHHVTVHDGVPVTTVPRTVFDLARRTGPRVLDRAVEEALRAPVHRGQPPPGAGRARRSGTPRYAQDADRAGRSRRRVRPHLERADRGRTCRAGACAGHRVGGPDVGPPGVHPPSRRLRPPWRVVIEFDGAAFHDQPSDIRADTDQDRRLIAAGNVVERLRWVDLTRRPEATLAKVLRLVTGGAA